MSSPEAEVMARLDNQPILRRILGDCLDVLRQRGDASVALKGSLARGNADAYADIDLVVVPPGWVAEPAWQEAVVADICGLGRAVSVFRATHIPLPNVWIIFLDIQGQIVKVDIDFAPKENVTDPAHIVLHDPAGTLERTLSHPATLPPEDFPDLFRKFTGWAWYTYTKIARGELFEGDSSLEVMRQQALLPFLHQRHGLPREGFRWLEERLPAGTQQHLLATYPASLERAELMRALRALVDLFDLVSADVLGLGSPSAAPADLGAITEAILRAEGLD